MCQFSVGGENEAGKGGQVPLILLFLIHGERGSWFAGLMFFPSSSAPNAVER